MKRIVLAIGFAALTSFAQPCLAQDIDVAAKDLPKPVTDAVLKRFPQATLIGAQKVTVNGDTIYEVKVKEAGAERKYSVTPDGIFQKVEKAP